MVQAPNQPRESKKVFHLFSQEESQVLLGARDENLRVLQQHFSARIVPRGETLTVLGQPDEVDSIATIIEELLRLVRQGERISRRDVEYLLTISQSEERMPPKEQYAPVTMPLRGKKGVIKPKTYGQRRYLHSITQNDIVFGIGPAGTGKTYLAMAAAVACLERKEIRRIILTRPAVEAGESLGYLPGDLRAKVDPYLRPLYDALYDMLPAELVQRYLDQEIVEIAPLAFMRGRTLNGSFVILDEAQNTTREQMKMFLTRLGYDSKAIITGDITQTDLPSGKQSGLLEVKDLLSAIPGIDFIFFDQHDIVRHPLVQKIVEAYEVRDKKSAENGKPAEAAAAIHPSEAAADPLEGTF